MPVQNLIAIVINFVHVANHFLKESSMKWKIYLISGHSLIIDFFHVFVKSFSPGTNSRSLYP